MANSRVIGYHNLYTHPHNRHKNNVWRREKEGALNKVHDESKKTMSNKSNRKTKSLSSPLPHEAHSIEKVCKFWAESNCVKGDNCRYLHSWSRGDVCSFLTTLQGHNKAITGISLPSLGSGDKLYSSCNDGTLRLWDCHTGHCSRVIDHEAQVGSLINEGPWIFIGLPALVKAWNTENDAEFSLDGPVGQVHSMIVANGILFAGTQSGLIVAWKGSPEKSKPFQLLPTLTGHTAAVLCLAFGGNRLFSASLDQTIRVWDIDTLQCIATLKEHSDAVMSLVYWGYYLLSCSLDGTIKVWATTQEGNIEVIYTHNEEHGLLALNGITLPGKTDEEADEHILFCSCNDNSVRIYDIPSFKEKGRLFSRHEVRTIQKGPQGLLFTGDGTGITTVWKMNTSVQDV